MRRQATFRRDLSEELIQRIVQRPAEASYSDVWRLLAVFGWEHASTRGSHARFTKPGERSLIIPVHSGKVKRVYLDEVCERLNLDEETEAH